MFYGLLQGGDVETDGTGTPRLSSLSKRDMQLGTLVKQRGSLTQVPPKSPLPPTMPRATFQQSLYQKDVTEEASECLICLQPLRIVPGRGHAFHEVRCFRSHPPDIAANLGDCRLVFDIWNGKEPHSIDEGSYGLMAMRSPGCKRSPLTFGRIVVGYVSCIHWNRTAAKWW